jgi:hypothetical protein
MVVDEGNVATPGAVARGAMKAAFNRKKFGGKVNG